MRPAERLWRPRTDSGGTPCQREGTGAPFSPPASSPCWPGIMSPRTQRKSGLRRPTPPPLLIRVSRISTPLGIWLGAS
jgi:hypothetical protein